MTPPTTPPAIPPVFEEDGCGAGDGNGDGDGPNELVGVIPWTDVETMETLPVTSGKPVTTLIIHQYEIWWQKHAPPARSAAVKFQLSPGCGNDKM
jgi:hypothetical protein